LSADDALLVFLDEHVEIEGWLQLADGRVIARGRGADGMPMLADADGDVTMRQVAVVPGNAVTLHWLEVPSGLAPAQAVAAARLMAADVSAQPLDDMHIAVGPEAEERAERAVALVPAIVMAGWIGALQGRGIDPDLLLPEPLLLPAPEEGFVRYDRGERPLFRGGADAFSIEPELADVIVAGAPVQTISHGDYEAGLAAAIDVPPVNLRQGAFAKRRAWTVDWALVRRLALLAAAIVLVTLAIQIALIMRYTYAADALEEEARQVAGTAVPGAATAADPRARLIQRLADLRGGGAGYAASASALFAAVNAVPNVELASLSYAADGSLRATLQGDSPATLTAVQDRVVASGFAADMGEARMGGGRQVAEITVRPR
jgi:general secretion pathway protein L